LDVLKQIERRSSRRVKEDSEEPRVLILTLGHPLNASPYYTSYIALTGEMDGSATGSPFKTEQMDFVGTVSLPFMVELDARQYQGITLASL